MNNFYMIGADGRQYGPATEEQVRKWIAEGRAAGNTLLQMEGAAWRPLATYPEFAGVIAQVPPLLVPPGLPTANTELKSSLAAGLLGVFLGGLGIHRFYLGYVGIGIAQIIVTIVTCGIGHIWGFIEGICILAGTIRTDAQGRPLKP
jgi:TM2 domain-containing membrane protein YozV